MSGPLNLAGLFLINNRYVSNGNVCKNEKEEEVVIKQGAYCGMRQTRDMYERLLNVLFLLFLVTIKTKIFNQYSKHIESFRHGYVTAPPNPNTHTHIHHTNMNIMELRFYIFCQCNKMERTALLGGSKIVTEQIWLKANTFTYSAIIVSTFK